MLTAVRGTELSTSAPQRNCLFSRVKQTNSACGFDRTLLRRQMTAPKARGWTFVGFTEGIIEAADAAETGFERNLPYAHISIWDQSLGSLHAPRSGDLAWRSSYMSSEQSQEMSRADTKLFRQSLHRVSIEESFPDEPHCTRDSRSRSPPCWTSRCSLGAASETWAVSQSLRSSGARYEEYIVLTGVRTRANRAAINSRRFHTGEECTIKSRVAA